ncbi:MAG TPA: hypothetical protein VMF52_10365 [Steroidobacteraceae bacterium]|nr:hypothetical protein [Steroidobacteraceae bacterium]
MGLSETIVAAIIGALATMGTAIFQLVRNRAPNETRPKKNRVRSLVATIALMIGCIVGGYAWSALRAVSMREEIETAMDARYQKQFAELVTRLAPKPAAGEAPNAAGTAIPARNGDSGSAEAVVRLPACHVNSQPDEVGPVLCTAPVVQSVEICATVPSGARTTNVRLDARVPNSTEGWMTRDAGAATVGSVHVNGEANEYPVSPDHRSVCLDVSNWSVTDTLAVRITVDYVYGPDPAAALTAAAPTAHTL